MAHGDDHAHDAARPGRGGDQASYFDEQARDWDDAAKVERARVLAARVRQVVDVGPATRMLEYGAGTGLGTEHLVVGGIGSVTLAEPSAGMRAVLADKVADGRLPGDAEVVDLDLATSHPPAASFDLVLTIMTLHHIPDLDRVLRGLASVVAPEGHLCIVDLVAEDGSFHQHLDDFDGHDGFTRDQLTDAMVGAGLAAPSWEVVHHLDKDGDTYPLFLAVAGPA